MICKGVVKDNVVLLEAGAHLPDGAEVEIRLLERPLTRQEVFARVRTHLARSAPAAPVPDGEAPKLTQREREILSLLAAGLDQRAIAGELVISSKTVGTHIQRILAKLGVGSRAQAVAFAHRHGLAGDAVSLTAR